MAVYVCFVRPRAIASIGVQLLTGARATEALTAPATTTGMARDGEIALVVNDDDESCLVATGATPDAATTTATSDSTAGVLVPAGGTLALAVNVGDKVNAKAPT